MPFSYLFLSNFESIFKQDTNFYLIQLKDLKISITKLHLNIINDNNLCSGFFPN